MNYAISFIAAAPVPPLFAALDTPTNFGYNDASELLDTLNLGGLGWPAATDGTDLFPSFEIVAPETTNTYYEYEMNGMLSTPGGPVYSWSMLTGSPGLRSAYAKFTPVPEPNTAVLFLLCIGSICLIGLRRKFKGQIQIA